MVDAVSNVCRGATKCRLGDFRVRATWTGVGVIGRSGVGTAAVALDRRRPGNQSATIAPAKTFPV